MSDAKSDGETRPLAGARAWIITRDRAGNLAQATGLAGALGVNAETKLVAPSGLAGLIAPFGPPPPGERFGRVGARFAPPWPDVAIGIGRAAVPYLRAVKRQGGASTFAIMLMDPHVAHREFDLVWVPEHDRHRGPNAIVTPTVMHGFSPERIDGLRQCLPPDVLALPRPRVAVILGGRNKVYRYGPRDHARLTAVLSALGRDGASFMITTSRRTHAELVAAAIAGTDGRARIVHTGAGDNPYQHFLAGADRLVVTGDSVSMASEAAATGRPIDLFVPEGRGGKFARFHAALFASGLARPLADPVEPAAAATAPVPVFATDVVAREVERRWRLGRPHRPHE